MEASSSGKVTAPQEPAGPVASRAPRRHGWAGASTLRRLGLGVGRLSLVTVTYVGSLIVIAAVLLVRNAYLFTTKIYENQDFAANTIAILQARHFDLLTGNYSKEGFYHPGPALLYVEAAGESFFHDLTHLVPTPWNGQLIAILLLNAVLIAAALAVFAGHTDSGKVPLACLAVVLLFAALHPLTVNSEWMPYVYFAPALLLLASAASVAAGQTKDLPLLALAALLCINGQAEFLLFGPVIALVALAGLITLHRHSLHGMFRGRAWDWGGALAVAALLAFPIVLNTIIHWPGQFGNYVRYIGNVRNVGRQPIHHSLTSSIGYVLRYWWPGRPASTAEIGGLCLAAVVGLLALTLALRCSVPRLRRFLLWSLAMTALMTALFVYYARTGISDQNLKQGYLGYFYWAVPLLVVLVAAAAAALYLQRWRPARPTLAVATAAAVVVAVVVPQHVDYPADPQATYLGVPQLPQVVRELAALAHGRPIVLRIAGNNWQDAVGVVAFADRTAVQSCVVGAPWTILFRAQSMCTADQVRAGVSFWFSPSAARTPPGSVVVATFPQTHTVVTRLS